MYCIHPAAWLETLNFLLTLKGHFFRRPGSKKETKSIAGFHFASILTENGSGINIGSEVFAAQEGAPGVFSSQL
ncbi:hypothetical protein EB796_009892 [Bugula neritina]|uniref:Uncharacterized protein n=1 Tax=Bugula neritina TaxID=10212 RepID=A0A7J7K2G3_BUGNE|nr:hypothetical protein EB796_009892 [Bugula neritina]